MERQSSTSVTRARTTTGQCAPLSLVESQRGSALIGRELHSVATPVSLGDFGCEELVLYVIRIVGFHARKGSIIDALMP